MMLEKKWRFCVGCCCRGWGKSYLGCSAAITAATELMYLPADVPDKWVAIIAPTLGQVSDIYFPRLSQDFELNELAVRTPSKDIGKFFLPNNVEIHLLSYENVERIRGKGYYFIVWDEVSSCKKSISPKKAWESIIQPAVVTRWSRERSARFGAPRPGSGLFISTPKGHDDFYDMYNMKYESSDWGSFHFDYTQSSLDIDEVEALRKTLDPVEFESEYLASFLESGNRAFHCFSRDGNVMPLPDFGEKEDVHVNIDFNVGLQCSSIFALRGDQIHVLDELRGHPDTEQLAIVLSTRFKGHKIYGYPDPSGRSRHTSSQVGRTDFTILEKFGITCLAHSRAPGLKDSVTEVNRMLRTADGVSRLFIDPRCKGVISSMERTKWVDGNPNTAAIDKSGGHEHYSDGIRYGVNFLFPILRSGHVRRGFGF
jgi:hypothetical protein